MCAGDHAWLEQHSQLLLTSYKRLTGKALMQVEDPASVSAQLYKSPFALLSHGTEDGDPVLNYGNLTALKLWEMNWRTFTSTPSRLTAEPMDQARRAQFMQQVKDQGYSDGYEGIRVSSSGRRFRIENAVIWNVIDDEGRYLGQAAMIPTWTEL